jgi:CheY-like chemotaxis protein
MSASILVVDDEPDVAERFRQCFRPETRQGTYVLHFASSGEEALDKLAAGIEPQLIVILSDINMPVMDGLELLREIKTRRPDLPAGPAHPAPGRQSTIRIPELCCTDQQPSGFRSPSQLFVPRGTCSAAPAGPAPLYAVRRSEHDHFALGNKPRRTGALGWKDRRYDLGSCPLSQSD